ncbi:MAG: hypothetical protein Q7V00_00990 [Sulfurimicrobium sp.]|nr:hypothetical protein [Sulfurimicrobium sp.]MDO9188493.1 hypothetical protein [Sulfurimicrobium sp.]MDP1705484.1 hypothetical protein [Sulfurimicrobium sp.]MDP2198008.1 hypothetical protein [Sulfurimicrobium sp.]MDZ7655223.1 hypothetical protein [Sulfurimicrobium sp.]
MDTVDVLIHVHPELTSDARAKVEREVMACAGVIAANFDHHKHPHALTVLYNPDAVKDKQILEVVRQHDAAATMIGL